jgi:ribulose-phosphate 3-epimerase
MRVSLSLWSVDQARLADEIARYEPVVGSFHVDVTDGRFVDDLLFGPLTVQTVRRLTDRQLVVHLMVAEPRRWVGRFVDAGADLLMVHASADGDFAPAVRAILDAGAAAGGAIGLDEPHRPVLDALGSLSVVAVMGTSIGVKGRPFDGAALDTIRRFARLRDQGAGPEVYVDGGIRSSSVGAIAAAGADGVVAGSIVTGAADPVAAAARLAALGG